MGLTKQYLRYVPDGVLNYLAAQRCNIATIQEQTNSKGDRRSRSHWIAFACGEIIHVWDIRRNEKVLQFTSVAEEVTCLAFMNNEKLLAAGYADGSIAVYNLFTEQLVFSQKGHKSSVNCIAFNSDGSLLASGSNDTETILWDVVGQTSLCRLKGHKSPITDCRFMLHHPYLLTSSKDSLLKVWDLQTYRCCSTLVGHKSEINKFVLLNEDQRLVTGSADSEIRVYDLTFVDPKGEVDASIATTTLEENVIASALENESTDTNSSPVRWKMAGSIIRKDRIVGMAVDPTGGYLSFHGNDAWLECIKMNTDEKVKELLGRRVRKKRKKMKKELLTEDAAEDPLEEDEPLTASELLELQFTKLPPHKCGGKIFSLVFLKKAASEPPTLLLNLGNSLRSVSIDVGDNLLKEASSVALPAHRFDIRTSAITSDGNTIITSCSEHLRIWNREAMQCVHTIPCDYAVSSALIPGDRFLVLGSKNGKLELFDIIEGVMHVSIQAHAGPVWGLCLYNDARKSIITGGEDKEVKFWDLDFGSPDSDRGMTLTCRKTVKMDDSVASVRLSPDQKLLAVALLDNTVKVMMADSLKFRHSLYGHALPVTCMDISWDSRFIVTGSADKNVKIWQLEFGDVAKSLFAHDDSVTSVLFIPRTHMFFSAGRDGKIKQWDADKHERITTFSGHHSEVWSLALTADGRTLVSTSHDRSIRLWQKTDEILVLDEERETEREQEFEKQANQTEEPVIAGEVNKEIGPAGRQTFKAMQAAEKIVEALNILREEKSQAEAGVKEPPHALLVAYGNITSVRYVLETLKRIKPSELQGALLSLSLNDAVELIQVLKDLLLSGTQTELVTKALTYLLRVNALQIESNKMLLLELDELRSHGTDHLDRLRNLVSFNRAGLEHLQLQLEERDDVKLFSDATQQFTERKKKLKKRAVLSMAS
ncbi:WD repeat-containing protein 3 [Hypsibius exemplaris]|uniref:WD repeat-containing protein 3 n=1 Tax=Hypsibius exemplaris TaxID=2072580 RepID=A0A1W0WFX5_HYPEX|nr:WD repeat-containing protein 3 [Hypsibius exemplaris]